MVRTDYTIASAYIRCATARILAHLHMQTPVLKEQLKAAWLPGIHARGMENLSLQIAFRE